jgi:hypothetical protein
MSITDYNVFYILKTNLQTVSFFNLSAYLANFSPIEKWVFLCEQVTSSQEILCGRDQKFSVSRRHQVRLVPHQDQRLSSEKKKSKIQN